MDWLDQPQNRDKWRALVSVVMNMRRISYLAENLLVS